MFKKGNWYICIDSKSNAYSFGKSYECHFSNDLGLYLIGNDGIKDPVKNLQSKFRLRG
jgi:hypothetical protein